MPGHATLGRTIFLITAVIGTVLGGAQTPSTVTNTEPGIYQLTDLYLHSDKVALVKVIAGDSEAYEVPIYKGRVISAFKGVANSQIIYFGPYLGTKIGSEYFLFLRDVTNPIQSKDKSNIGFGNVNYSSVFDEGYTSMLTAYQCIFGGSTINQQCDYGVRVCTDYIKLPKSVSTFPMESDIQPFGCRWVLKDQFTSILNEIKESIGR